MRGPSEPPGPAIFLSWRAADVAPRPGTRRPRRRTKTRNRTDPKTGRIKILAKNLAGQAQTQIRDSLILPSLVYNNKLFVRRYTRVKFERSAVLQKYSLCRLDDAFPSRHDIVSWYSDKIVSGSTRCLKFGLYLTPRSLSS
jgi:hypothetical protein